MNNECNQMELAIVHVLSNMMLYKYVYIGGVGFKGTLRVFYGSYTNRFFALIKAQNLFDGIKWKCSCICVLECRLAANFYIILW